MLTLGPIAFLSPWLLAPLVGLPILWWLLRLTPPAPRKIDFPAIRLLMGIKNQEETPRHTPWWLLLLRLLIVVGIFAGLAQPVLNPTAQLSDEGPLLLVIDDGWASGPVWPRYQGEWQQLMNAAERNDRPVHLLFTAQPGIKLSEPLRAADARQLLASHKPSPWGVDRLAARKALEGFNDADALYFSDGTDSVGSTELMVTLRDIGVAKLYTPAGGRLPLLLMSPQSSPDGLKVTIRRAGPLPESTAMLRATANDGRLLSRETIPLPAGQTDVTALLTLPAELRNAITRLELEGERHAGAVVLLDEHWRRRPVGLVAGSGADQPLLGETFYLEKALQPFADVHKGNIDTLVTQGVAMLVLADIGSLSDEQQAQLTSWMEAGGVLLRFAGPNLANTPDPLLPVTLRAGERTLGGSLSWSEPQRLKGFTPDTPLAGLIPPDDVRVNKQVLAQPEAELAAKTWVTLEDGTPLVTGTQRGKGWLVLVHTTANADWSNLALSGVYVDILRRLLQLSSGLSATEAAGALLPVTVLDGFGQFVSPPATAQPIDADKFNQQQLGPTHPPGFYGREGMQSALNLTGTIQRVTSLPDPPTGVSRADDDTNSTEVPLMPYLITAALILFTLDMLVALRIRGLMMLLLLFALPAQAQEASDYASKTWLAYVVTGDSSVDADSAAGLKGIMQTLKQRTSVEPAGVAAINLDSDDISLFPLLYWPVTESQPALTPAAIERLNRYMQNGGMIVFDTRDGAAGSSGNKGLQRLARGLNLPPLAPIKPDHVLTRSFYLLQDFPGRLSGGQVWVDASPERRNDNVSGVIVGSNDWAGGWAVDNYGQAANSNGRGGTRQREMSLRFGVNLVMYALAGNYKSDQVHMNTILERLGR